MRLEFDDVYRVILAPTRLIASTVTLSKMAALAVSVVGPPAATH